MSICYDFVLELIAAIKNKPYNMNKFAKNVLLSSSLSYSISHSPKKKKHKDNSLCLFWRGRRDSTGQALSCLLRKLSHFLSLLLRKRWTIEFESLLFNFTLPKKKKHKDNSLCFFWRGRRDSNSRAGFPTYALSRGASSPT